MSIPEESIVAGAKAMDAYWGGRYAPDEVEELRGEVTAMLEAAAPYMLADVWEEGGRAATGTHDTGYPSTNPYRSKQ